MQNTHALLQPIQCQMTINLPRQARDKPEEKLALYYTGVLQRQLCDEGGDAAAGRARSERNGARRERVPAGEHPRRCVPDLFWP